MYKLSELAAEDFAGIYEYSLLNFGLQQAEHFTENLESALLLL
jgi:toxin ParE1/3/4